MTTEARPTSWSRAATAVLLLVAATYCFAVTMTVAPWSPLTHTVRRVTDPILGSQFSQNWTLFSPSPPSVDADILVQYRCGRGAASPLYELSRNLRERGRIQGLFTTASQNYTIIAPAKVPTRSAAFFELDRQAKFDETLSDKLVEEITAGLVENDRRIFRRFVAAAASSLPGAGACDPKDMKLRSVVVLRPLDRYVSHVDDELVPSFVYDSGFYPMVLDVERWPS